MSKYGKSERSRRYGFVLLEVMISMIILSVVIGTVMRSFTLSLKTIRKTEVMTIGCFLGELLLDEFETIPPKMGETRGTFERLGEKYSKYFYVVKMKEEEVKYSEGFKLEGDQIETLETMLPVSVDIFYDDPTYGETLALHLNTYLLQSDRFTENAKRENAIF